MQAFTVQCIARQYHAYNNLKHLSTFKVYQNFRRSRVNLINLNTNSVLNRKSLPLYYISYANSNKVLELSSKCVPLEKDKWTPRRVSTTCYQSSSWKTIYKYKQKQIFKLSEFMLVIKNKFLVACKIRSKQYCTKSFLW